MNAPIYFPSYGAALRYYRPYVVTGYVPARQAKRKTEELRSLVDSKLNAAEIHIGRPPHKPGQTLIIEDNRYHITEETK